MLYYVCSLPDNKGPGRRPELISDDPRKITAFAKRWDVPGRSTYSCVALLRDGARRRSLAEVGALPLIHVDIDFRQVATPPEEVDRVLHQLPLAPEIRDSGGGRHVVWHLREPVLACTPEFDQLNAIRTTLTRALAGDPAPNHAAALLRHLGSRNFKYGKPPRKCRVLQEAPLVDITELAELADLLDGTRLIEPLAPAKVNGRDRHPGPIRSAAKVPVDVDARLAAMTFKGPADTSIHLTQLHCMGSLLRCGCPLDDATHAMLEATRRCVAGVAEAQSWDWRREEVDIRRMGTDLINKNPELSSMLPDTLRDRWDAKVAAGRRPRVDYTPACGWRVCGDGPNQAEPARTSARKAGSNPAAAPPRPGKEQPAKGRVTLTPFKAFDVAQLPPREWLYGKYYQRGTVSATIGPGGFGKTSLDLVEAIAMATCRNLLGDQPAERCRVWVHNGDDTMNELKRRVAAICQHYTIPLTELEDGRLFLTTRTELALTVANGYGELKVDAQLVRQIMQLITENEIDVAIFDPLVTLHTVPEGVNQKMDVVTRLFAQVAGDCDCAVDLVHHTRKLPPGTVADYSTDDMRGASAIRDAVRASRLLNVMSAAEGQKVGLNELDCRHYFRVDLGKANNAPPMRHATWRRFVGVEIANGDDVGVVTPWRHPGTADALTDDDCRWVQDQVRAGDYREDARAQGAWVGLLLAQRLGLDPTKPADKATLTDRVDELKRRGVTRVSYERLGGKNRPMVRPGPWAPGKPG